MTQAPGPTPLPNTESDQGQGAAPSVSTSAGPAPAAERSVANLADRIGLLAPRHGPDPYAHRRGEPRSFAVLWIGFVFASIIVTLGAVGVLGLSASDIYRPAARVLVVMLAAGVWVVWPLIRLSQEAPRSPVRSFLMDWVLVVLPVHGALWPQALPWMAAWPVSVVGACVAWISAWGLVVVAVLVLALGDAPGADSPSTVSSSRRWVAMAVLVLGALTGPVLALTQPRPANPGQTSATPSRNPRLLLLTSSPVAGVWPMVADASWTGQSARIEPWQWRWIGGVGLAGGASVVIAALALPRRRQS